MTKAKKKAVFGFRVIGMEDELRVSSPTDLKKRRDDSDYDVAYRCRQRKLKWWHAHKDELNRKRRAAAQSIEGRYKAAKAKALSKDEEWSFTPEEWEQKWIDAGWMEHPLNKTLVVPAFALRGAHRYQCTCMERKDLNGGWSSENTRIVFRGEELMPGCRWYREGPAKDG